MVGSSPVGANFELRSGRGGGDHGRAEGFGDLDSWKACIDDRSQKSRLMRSIFRQGREGKRAWKGEENEPTPPAPA
jgi:hypothetical protein